MNGEREGILEGSSHDLIKVLFWNLPGVTEENRKNLRAACVLVEIQTRHLQNRNLNLYHYANLLYKLPFSGVLLTMTYYSVIRIH
jgi:hypothetical protein